MSRRTLERLKEHLTYVPSKPDVREFTPYDRRLYGIVKTEGERVIKGRLINRVNFSAIAEDCSGGWRAKFMAVFNGRHAMSVCRQLAGILDDTYNGFSDIKISRLDGDSVILKAYSGKVNK